MTCKELEDLLKRYDEDTCTAEERRIVEKAFDAMRSNEGDISPELRTVMQNRLWQGLRTQMEGAPTPHRMRYTHLYWTIASAAAVLIFVLAGIFLMNSNSGNILTTANNADENHTPDQLKIFSNSGSEPQKLTLNDGSVITLQPGGEIRYPETFAAMREVYLSGDAFFEIARDPAHPFLVYANEVTTKVLGTSFRIKAYKTEKEILVAVKTGRVAVNTSISGMTHSVTSPENSVILTPNEQIIYNRDNDAISVALVEKPSLLQQPVSSNYTNAPVATILKSLEEDYGVEIQYDEKALAHCTITSNMTDEGLYEQVEVICNAIGARYEISGLSIIIEGHGCD